MTFALTEDQKLLRDNARAFFEERSPLTRVRALRDESSALGFSPELYQEMAELGFLGIAFSEHAGGLGLGFAEAVLVAEAMGRRLAPEPLLSSATLAGQLIALAGDDAQKQTWLPALASGDKRLAVAFYEPKLRYDLSGIACAAEARDGGFVLSGEKTQVLDAVGADAFVVAARTANPPGTPNGLTLFLVPADVQGLQVVAQHLVDHRKAGIVTFENVTLPESARLGAPDLGILPLLQAIDRATCVLCGEMVGGMSAAFEMTLDYLKERKQFGKHIGSFQALQHRAVDLFMEIELSRTAMMNAARALDSGDMGAPQAVSMAKARCADSYIKVANEAVQMFGGIGMTDEHDIGFYMKRARVSAMLFGDAAFHRDRWATLNGF